MSAGFLEHYPICISQVTLQAPYSNFWNNIMSKQTHIHTLDGNSSVVISYSMYKSLYK